MSLFDSFYKFKYFLTKNDYIYISCNNDLYDNDVIDVLIKYKALFLQGEPAYYEIPEYVTKLAINFDYYETFEMDMIHENITHLTIFSRVGGEAFNHSDFVSKLPSNLEYLEIKSYLFNQSIDYLPLSLKTLKLDIYSFNHSLSNLPPGLETIELTYIGLNVLDDEITVLNDNLLNFPASIKNIYINKKYMDKYESIYHFKSQFEAKYGDKIHYID